MNTGKAFIVFFLAALASDSFAQIDLASDSIGIYFDPEATQVSTSIEVGGMVTAYLIATNPSQMGGLALWEASVQSQAPEVIIWGSPANGTNLATNMPPGGSTFSFVVTSDTPLPPLESITILGTLDITVLSEGPVELEVHGYSYDLPIYRVDDWTYPDHDLYPSSGNPDFPVAVINGPPPVAIDQMSWGHLKSHFR